MKIKKNPRIILNELKWRQEINFNKVEIWYIHRGAPNDTMIIYGKDVLNLYKSFMQTNSAMIPYHRIFKIIYDNNEIFNR
jgi:uncharacterized protein (UPF0248 family)